MEAFDGRFTLLRALGHGGMGSVWLAVDRTTGGECALKRLQSNLPVSERDSLRREFELLTRVRHPSIVAAYELGFAPDGTLFYTMEYVPGIPASAAVGPGDWTKLYDCAVQLAQALEVLHAAGVIHGDIKPSNVLVLPHPRGPASVRLLDLGLAALLGRDGHGHRGTPGYAAPEVVAGSSPSIASDLYGFGAMLYVLALRCAANAPWPKGEGPQPPNARTDVALTLEEAAVPEGLVRLVLNLLAAEPAGRPTSARQVRRELERLHPTAARSLAERLENEILVGRQPELARFDRWLAMAPKGPSMLVLTGESGAGRSAVLAAISARASLAGHPIVIVTCRAGGSGTELRAILRRFAVERSPESSADPRTDALLARLEDPSPLGDELAAHEETILRWVTSAQSPAPGLLVCIDDADRLEPGARAWLRRLALHPAARGLRWVWSVPVQGHTLSVEDALLCDSGHAEHLDLGPLERPEVEALVGTRLHTTPPAELMDALWGSAGGHAGLLVETLRVAVASGAIAETDSGIALDRERLRDLPRALYRERTSLHRLEALGSDAEAAATALAVFGGAITEQDLLRIEPRATAPALTALERAGLLSRDEDGRIGLHPPAFSRSVIDSLETSARERLHRAVLELDGLLPTQRFAHLAGAGDVTAALAEAERVHASDLTIALEAARLSVNEEPGVAALWQERAGHALLARGRYRDAIPHMDRALELEPEGALVGRRWFLLSSALLRTGMRERLTALLAEALARSLADPERALLLANNAMRLGFGGDMASAIASGEEAVALAERSGDAEAQSIAALTLGSLRRMEGRLDEAIRLAAKAEDAATRCGHVVSRLRSAGLGALCTALQGRAEEAEKIYRESLFEAAHRGARLAEHELAVDLSWLLLETGRWNESREMMRRALHVALEENWPAAASLSLTNLALASALAGHVGGGLSRARAALRMVRQHQPMSAAFAWRTLATALRVRGHAHAGLRAARRALDLAHGRNGDTELAWSRYEFGRICAANGLWAEARSVWEMGIQDVAANELSRPILLAACGRAAIRAEKLPVAIQHLADAEAWLADRKAPYARAHVDQLRAEIALARGEAEAGMREVAIALRGFGDLPAPPDAAAAALEFARVALRAGLGARTQIPEWLRTAATGFERLGDHRQRERALALAVDWHRRYSPAGADPSRNRDLLQSVTRLIDSQPGLEELSRRAMRLAVEQLDAERGVLILVEDATGQPRPVVEYGAVDAATRDQAVSYSRDVVARVAASGGAFLVGDLTTDPGSLTHSMVELGLRSVLCVPIFSSGRVIGAVYLDDSRRAEAFGETERGLLEGFSQLLAAAIENSREHEEVRRENEQLVGENQSLRREVHKRHHPLNFIGASSVMQKILAVVERAAEVPSTVLITGENGTGKELIARLIHHMSARALKPFVAVNCGAIPPTLLESELFGILANVATGVRARDGRFVEAHGGTLFLDEIGDMPPAQQVALLSVLANRKVTPVGGGRPIDVDVRVIAATNRDLHQKIAEGSFRDDLWYRLNVVPIEMPALRERKADIPALARHFAAMFASQQGREVPALSQNLLAVLMQSDWPGNVRELQNYIERLMAMNPGKVLDPKPLPHDLEKQKLGKIHPRGNLPLEEQVAELERRQVESALERNLGNQSKAARELGLTEQSLRYRLRKYAIGRGRRYRRKR